MPHLEKLELSEEERREQQGNAARISPYTRRELFFSWVYCVPTTGFYYSVLILWLGTLMLYIVLVLWVVKSIVALPDRLRTINTEKDIYDGLTVLISAITRVFLSLAIPFLLKGIILKQFGKYWSDRKEYWLLWLPLH